MDACMPVFTYVRMSDGVACMLRRQVWSIRQPLLKTEVSKAVGSRAVLADQASLPLRSSRQCLRFQQVWPVA